MAFNKYQSTLLELNIDSYPEEIKESFFDFLNNVPYIKNLISDERPYAKDCPRDEEGKIIVDLTNPPIIEDVDYFRPSAIHFQKYGCYTKLRPNLNPNSEFGKWFREELRRCYFGYVRPSDGAWVTGDMYFFLNYCPIMKVKVIKGNKGIRVIDFPDFLEGLWLKYMYIELARDNAKHGAELAARGRGKSFSMASIMAKRFILGEYDVLEKKVLDRVETFCASYLKNFLNEDGVLNKFESYIDFCSEYTLFPRKRLISSMNNMRWLMGYKSNNSEAKKGSLNEVIGVSVKDSPGKLRGKRGAFIGLEEMGCHIKGTEVLMYDNSIKKVENIKKGDLLLGPDGNFRKVLKLYSGWDLMYKITLSNGDWQIVNSTHPIRFIKHNWDNNTDSELLLTAPNLIGKNLQGCYIEKANIQYPNKKVLIDPYFLGLWLGDGDSSRLDIANKDDEVLNWLSENYKQDSYIRNLKLSSVCKIFHISKKNILNEYFKIYNLYNNKHIPKDYIYNSKDVHLQLLAGLIDTDGNLSIKEHGSNFEITLRYDRKHILDAIKYIATNCGLRCTMSSRISNGKKPGILHYRLKISGNIDIIPTKVKRKLIDKKFIKYKQRRNWNYYTFNIEPYKIDNFYGFTIDGDHLFILKDGTIVHNTFPNLIELYGTLRPSMEDGNVVFGMIYALGCVCAGTKVWTLDGRNINIEDLKVEDGIIGYTTLGISKLVIGTLLEPSLKPCLRITLSNGNILECSTDHPVLVQIRHSPRIKNTEKRFWVYEEGFMPAEFLKVGDRICEAREIPVFGKNTLFDARLVGMLIGDGTYGFDNTPKFCSLDLELLQYVESKYSTSLSATHITKEGKAYKEIRVKGICKDLRKIGIYGQVKLAKRLPTEYQTLTYQDTIDLLGGLFDTDGSIYSNNEKTQISITLSNEYIIKEIQILLRKLGIISNISKINPRISPNRKDKNVYYTLSIRGRENLYFFNKHIHFLVLYKQEALNKAIKWFEDNPSLKPCSYNWKLLKVYKIVAIESLGQLTIYNLSAICSKSYLANNIITHNTAGDKDSDFQGASQIMYSPRAFNMLPIKNVYDKVGLGKPEFVYFYPAYVNRNGCYNKDGISDVTKAILEVLINRYNVKYNSNNISLITKTIAEHPIVPLEAIMKSSGNLFPAALINERIGALDSNPNIFDDVYIGTLVFNNAKEVVFKPTSDMPIREYPIDDNKDKGAIEIFEMPLKDNSGKVFSERYIIGHDPKQSMGLLLVTIIEKLGKIGKKLTITLYL